MCMHMYINNIFIVISANINSKCKSLWIFKVWQGSIYLSVILLLCTFNLVVQQYKIITELLQFYEIGVFFLLWDLPYTVDRHLFEYYKENFTNCQNKKCHFRYEKRMKKSFPVDTFSIWHIRIYLYAAHITYGQQVKHSIIDLRRWTGLTNLI